jgi:Uma2 family endonuclease
MALSTMALDSSAVVGRHMPAVVSLDDLTAMMAAVPHGHRYEVSPEGVLSVRPPDGYGHAVIATQIVGWLLSAGVPADRVTQGVGLRILGRDGTVGGRIPDLTVWSAPQRDGMWLPVADVVVVVEIVSPASEATDTVAKRHEYAMAGIPQYWTIDAPMVTIYRLVSDVYRVRATCPLAWILKTSVAEHLG